RVRPARAARADRARAALPRADRAARRGARRRRHRARHAPVRRAPSRRLRGDALPRRDAGDAGAPLRRRIRAAWPHRLRARRRAARAGAGGALARVTRPALPLATPWPALQGFLVGLVLLLGFALPPLLQLKNVPALRVIRREAGAPRGGALLAYAIGFGALAAL